TGRVPRLAAEPGRRDGRIPLAGPVLSSRSTTQTRPVHKRDHWPSIPTCCSSFERGEKLEFCDTHQSGTYVTQVTTRESLAVFEVPPLQKGRKEVRRHNSVYTPWRTIGRFPSA